MKQLFISALLVFPFCALAQVSLDSTYLPIVLLETNGQEIPDDPKINIVMQVIDNGPGQVNRPGDPPNHFNGTVGIELRRSTSAAFFEKKPYSVEIRDQDGEDLDFPLLGMPEESDWVFLAPINDKSLIREALMFELARKIMPWAPRCRFVELILNGDYRGIYLVTERIKRDNNRVDIARLKSSDLAGDSLTGGYILKLDKTTGSPSEGWISPYLHQQGAWQTTLWQIDYPNIDDIQPAQKDYIQQWITQFEGIMASPAFADTAIGYPKWLDVASFVDFTLLNEMAKCVDAYRISTYLYKDRDDRDPRLHAGPVWDFNIAFGNAGYCTAENPEGWIIDFNQFCPDDTWIIQFWWNKMWEDPAYRRQLKNRWITLRNGPLSDDSVFGTLDSLSALLQDAHVRNFQRWPVLYEWLWPNVFCCGAYDEHLGFLRNWLNLRLEWMDGAANNLYLGEYIPENTFATSVFPNPSSGLLYFKCYAHHFDELRVSVFDLSGRQMEELTFDPEFNGENIFEWRYHTLRPGMYFYETYVNGKRETRGKIMVAK